MPRVHTKTKNRGGKRTYMCRTCAKPIMPGQSYYQWEKRYGGPQRNHTACGYPKASWLSGRKTAVIQDAIDEFDSGAWVPTELPEGYDPRTDGTVFEIDNTDELAGMLEDIASEADSVADEYEGGADNMPDSLQQGYQAEAMRSVAEALHSWADELRDLGGSPVTVDLPDPDAEVYNQGGTFALDVWRADAEGEIESAADGCRSEADDKLGEMPEYEG